MDNVRNYRMDNVKFFMILGIVLEHSLLIYGYPRQFEILWAIVISWLMPMFTIISGFFFKEKTICKYTDKYIYPLLLFSSINFIVGYFFYPSYHEGIHIVGYAMWYLWALFVFAVVTPPLLRHFDLKLLAILSGIVMIAYQIIPQNSTSIIVNALQINRIIGFYPYFLMGCLLKRNYSVVETKLSLTKSRILCVCFLSLYTICCLMCKGLVWNSGFYLSFGTNISGIARILLTYAFISFIAFFLLFSVPNKKYFFSEYGMRTMNVYMLHMLIVFPFSYGVFSKQPDCIAFIVCNSIVCILLCTIFFCDFVNRCMYAILGNKKWFFAILLWIISIGIVNCHVF